MKAGWNSGWAVPKSPALASSVSGSCSSSVAWQSLQKRWAVGAIWVAPSCSVWHSTQRPGGMSNVSLKASSTLPQVVRPGWARARRNGSAWSWMPVWQILAGGVGHRLERPYVASLAVVLEGGMGERQFAAGPHIIGMKALDCLFLLLPVDIALDRPGKKHGEHHRDERPGGDRKSTRLNSSH